MKKNLSSIKDFFKRIEFEPLTRSQKYGMSTVVAVILVLAIVVFLEILSYNHNKRFDLTADKRFTVSLQTTTILKSLTQDMKAVAFVTNEDKKTKVGDLLEQYKYSSDGKFEYRFVDLYLNPGEAKTFNVQEDNTIVLIYGDRQERVVLSDTDILDSGEQKLTDAIVKMVSAAPKTVYFLSRHGERDITDATPEGFSQLKTALESQNYVVKPLDLTTEGVPEDASSVIIASPKKDLFDEEVTAIGDYLNKGGSLFVMIDPDISVPKLSALLSGIGIEVRNDIIIDRDSKVLGGDYLMPVANEYLKHPIIKNITALSFFPYSRSVAVDNTIAEAAGWKIQYLVKTGSNSWAETDLSAMRKGKAEFNKGIDTPGPVSVAAVGTKEIKTESTENENQVEARIVVFGNSAFVANGYYLAASHNASNVDIFLNCTSWLAGNESLISIHPKDKKSTPLFLTGSQGLLIFLVCVVIVPFSVLGVGAFFFFRRRFKE